MKNELFIYLQSNDSLDVYPDNKVQSFIVKLPGRLYLHGKWVCALSEIYLPPIHLQTGYATPRIIAIDVCSPLCSDTVTGESRAPVIRRLLIEQEAQVNGTCLRFNPLQYTELIRHETGEIHIYLRHESPLHFPVANAPLYCTLHLKKVA